jgi:hypothetical protein
VPENRAGRIQVNPSFYRCQSCILLGDWWDFSGKAGYKDESQCDYCEDCGKRSCQFWTKWEGGSKEGCISGAEEERHYPQGDSLFILFEI